MGVGFGLLNTTYIVAIQSSVPWKQRGVATASNMLMRNLGNAVGAALLGGVLNLQMARYLGREDAPGGGVSVDSVQDLMSEAAPRAAQLSAAVARRCCARGWRAACTWCSGGSRSSG